MHTEKDPIKEAVVIQPEKPIASSKNNSAITAVLQWLSYSFWGWTAVTIGWLVWLIVGHLLYQTGSDSPALVPSVIAAVIILLIISLITDWVYSRREVEEKTGVSVALMVIYAVVYGLTAVGVLVTIVINIITMLVTSDQSELLQATTVAFSVVFVLYLLIVVRVIKPFIFSNMRFTFRIVFSLIAVIAIILAIVGPVAQSAKLRDDRAVRNAMSSLTYSIDSYAEDQGNLPETLEELVSSDSFTSNESKALLDLVERKLITYTPNIKPPEETTKYRTNSSEETKTYYYELCQTYSQESSVRSDRSAYYRGGSKKLKVGQNCDQYETVGSEIKRFGN